MNPSFDNVVGPTMTACGGMREGYRSVSLARRCGGAMLGARQNFYEFLKNSSEPGPALRDFLKDNLTAFSFDDAP
jgi:hypothetical protein